MPAKIAKPLALKTPFWKDTLLLAAELTARNVYWRWSWLRRWVRRRRAARPTIRQTANRDELKTHLREIGMTEGALVMVHTTTSGVTLHDGPAAPENAPNVVLTAKRLVDDLMEIVGKTGTLLMPTNAPFQTQDLERDSDEPIRYDPAKTPCGVGLANELFRRRPGVQRSLYPYNMVAAYGPLADEMLRDNLNDTKPLPHGVDSPYYRLCQRDGLVVSIGVPLGDCLTLVHAAEDVRDEQWPVKGFFEERKYLVVVDGVERLVVVRHPRREYFKFCRANKKCVRDLHGAGLIHEGRVGTLRVDWAHAREVFDFLMARNEGNSYPFYCTWLVRGKR